VIKQDRPSTTLDYSSNLARERSPDHESVAVVDNPRGASRLEGRSYTPMAELVRLAWTSACPLCKRPTPRCLRHRERGLPPEAGHLG
jgi:hypothetical protein